MSKTMKNSILLKISQHYHWHDFHPEEWDPSKDHMIRRRVVEICEAIRKAWNYPVIIKRGVRSKAAHELLVEHGKASPNSAHVKGLACDFYCTDDELRWKAINILLAQGVTRIGIAKTYIHFDIDPNKEQHRLWIIK